MSPDTKEPCMFFPSLSKLKQRLSRFARRGRQSKKSFRPRLEGLEDRVVPADFRVTAQLQVLSASVGAPAGQQVVFFESGVADYQVLQKGLAAGTDAVVLDSGGDGLAEMAA